MTQRLRSAAIVTITLGSGLALASCDRAIEYTQATDSPRTTDQQAVTNDTELPDSIVVDMTKKALAGDDSAAVTLSLHYAAIGNVEASRKWLELAANRGDCNAISSLIWDLEIDNARSDVISKWQQRYKSSRCHPKIQYRYRE